MAATDCLGGQAEPPNLAALPQSCAHPSVAPLRLNTALLPPRPRCSHCPHFPHPPSLLTSVLYTTSSHPTLQTGPLAGLPAGTLRPAGVLTVPRPPWPSDAPFNRMKPAAVHTFRLCCCTGRATRPPSRPALSPKLSALACFPSSLVVSRATFHSSYIVSPVPPRLPVTYTATPHAHPCCWLARWHHSHSSCTDARKRRRCYAMQWTTT